MIDALESVRLVTANGDIVEASSSSNPELSWGIRGAGFNFGIVTSACFKLSKAVNDGQVFTIDMVFPEHLKSAYFDALKTYEEVMPVELATSTVIAWDANTSAVSLLLC